MPLPDQYAIQRLLPDWLAAKQVNNRQHSAATPFLFLIKDRVDILQPDKVMKFLSDQADDDQQQHFLNEIKVLKQLNTPPQSFSNLILKLIGHGQADFEWSGRHWSGQYLTMPFYPKGDFASWLNRHSLSCQALQHYFLAILHALDALHQRGYLHLDLKPSNILLADGDELGHHILLSDFSLAQPIDSEAKMKQGGTPRYMSPEQFRHDPLSIYTDFYSVGLILYRMLTGQHAFEATTYMEWAQQHCQQAVPTLPEHLSQFQPVLDGLLAKHRQSRFQSIEQIQEAFLTALNV
jgi:serine/threonine protein kinase